MESGSCSMVTHHSFDVLDHAFKYLFPKGAYSFFSRDRRAMASRSWTKREPGSLCRGGVGDGELFWPSHS